MKSIHVGTAARGTLGGVCPYSPQTSAEGSSLSYAVKSDRLIDLGSSTEERNATAKPGLLVLKSTVRTDLFNQRLECAPE